MISSFIPYHIHIIDIYWAFSLLIFSSRHLWRIENLFWWGKTFYKGATYINYIAHENWWGREAEKEAKKTLGCLLFLWDAQGMEVDPRPSWLQLNRAIDVGQVVCILEKKTFQAQMRTQTKVACDELVCECF